MESSSKSWTKRAKGLFYDSKKHAFDVLQKLSKSRESDKSCDVILHVRDQKFPAHRNILRANSEYFHLLLDREDLKLERSIRIPETIFPKEIELLCFRMCLDYMYCCEIEVSNEGLLYLARYANRLCLTDLLRAITRCYKSRLSMLTFCHAMNFAKSFNSLEIMDACEQFASEHFEEFYQTNEYDRLPLQCVTDLLKSRRNKTSEINKVEAVMKWVQAEPARMTGAFLEFLENEYFRRVPSNYWRDLLNSELLVLCCERFARFIRSAISAKEAVFQGDISYIKPNTIAAFRCGLNQLQRYHPVDNTWLKMQELSSEIAGQGEFRRRLRRFSATVVGDYIYVIKMDKSVFRLECHYEKAVWERVESTKENHGISPVLNDGKRIYAVGNWPVGAQETVITTGIEAYSPENESWDIVSSKFILNFASSVYHRDFIYCMGGDKEKLPVNEVEVFNILSKEWSTAPPMLERRRSAGSVAYEGNIYVFGGGFSNTVPMSMLSTAECYDPIEKVWTRLNPMMTRKGICTAVVADGDIYLFSNVQDPSIHHTSIEKYYVKDNRWEEVQVVEKYGSPFVIFSPAGLVW